MTTIGIDTVHVKVDLALLKPVRERRLESCHRAYVLLKRLELGIERAGGIVGWSESVSFLKEFMSQARVYQLLAQGEGTFWRTIYQRDRKALLLTGATSLLDQFSPETPSSRVVWMPINDLKGKGWKAAIHAAEMKGIAGDGVPVSRQLIQRLTGLPEGTQRRYCRASRINRIFNFTKVPHVCKVHADQHETQQLPNSYEVDGLETSRSGRIRDWARRNTALYQREAAPSFLGMPHYVFGKDSGNRCIKLREHGVTSIYWRLCRPSSGCVWWLFNPSRTDVPIFDRLKGDCKGGQALCRKEEKINPSIANKAVAPKKGGQKSGGGHRMTPAEVVGILKKVDGLFVSLVPTSPMAWGACLWCAEPVAQGLMVRADVKDWYLHTDCLRPEVIELVKSFGKAPWEVAA